MVLDGPDFTVTCYGNAGAQSNDSSSPFCSNTRAACPKWSDNADFLQHTCHQGGKPYICEALVSNQNKCCVLSKDLPKPGSNTPVEAVFIQPSKPRVINPGKKVHPEHLWTRQSSKSVSALVPRSKFCVCKDGNASSRSDLFLNFMCAHQYIFCVDFLIHRRVLCATYRKLNMCYPFVRATIFNQRRIPSI